MILQIEITGNKSTAYSTSTIDTGKSNYESDLDLASRSDLDLASRNLKQEKPFRYIQVSFKHNAYKHT